MSKKTYKKRKQAAHTKAKQPRNVHEKTGFEKFLDNWLWLVTLVLITALAVCLVIFIPKCDEAGTCDSCASSCAKVEEDVSPSDLSDSDLSGSDTSGTDATASAATTTTTAPTTTTTTADPSFNISDYTDQFDAPKSGEEVAVFDTTFGLVKMRLFANAAPATVANFKNLIKSGYYDGTSFHRVISGFMIQGGDPTGTGSGGETFDGKPLADELDNGYYNFRGALAMANTGAAGSASSQFYIVQTSSISGTTPEALMSYKLPEWVSKQYAAVGGYYFGDAAFDHPAYYAANGQTGDYLGHTVFGQVYQGMTIVDLISMVEVNAQYKPTTSVLINKAYLETVA